jgi:RHS repeat-associated protein
LRGAAFDVRVALDENEGAVKAQFFRAVFFAPRRCQRRSLPLSATDSTTSSHINYASAAVYTAPGELASLLNSSMLLTSAYYNNRLQPCRISVNSSGTPLGSCTSSSVGNILDISYNFNAGSDNGNVMSIANNIDNMRSQTFAYDPLNRLLTAQTNATYSTSSTKCWGESYSYDPWGNLLGTGWPSSSYASCTQESPGPGGAVLANNQLSVDTYDAAGNMIAQGTCSTSVPSSNQYSYTYDAENHLVSETTASGANACQNVTTSYTYDGDGNRVEKSNGTIYWHGAGGDALDESNLSGSLANEYIFFGGQRIARRDPSSNVFYNFADHLGTARSIAEVPSGQTTATKCYDADLYPYGGERWYTDTCDSHFKFTGKERDPESGLDNFGARYNGSNVGRFMSPDWSASPMGVPYARFGDPQTLNLYAYVRNNPLGHADSDGHCPWCELLEGLSPAGIAIAAETLTIGAVKAYYTHKELQGIQESYNAELTELNEWAVDPNAHAFDSVDINSIAHGLQLDAQKLDITGTQLAAELVSLASSAQSNGATSEATSTLGKLAAAVNQAAGQTADAVATSTNSTTPDPGTTASQQQTPPSAPPSSSAVAGCGGANNPNSGADACQPH